MTIHAVESIHDLLLSLHQSDVHLWAEGEDLRFSAPPGALTPDLRARLGNRKAEILTFLKENFPLHAPTHQTIQPIERGNGLQLSFAQQRLWFMDQLDPGNPVYNIPFALRFTGDLDVTALKRTLGEIMRRHESLRTVIAEGEGQPVQLISEAEELELPLLDLSYLEGKAEQEVQVQHLMHQQALYCFDLRQGPLLRSHLLRLEAHSYLLVLVVHHLVFDGWSVGIFLREVQQIYSAYTLNQSSPCPELTIQYADYAQWQRDRLQGDLEARQLAYWKEQLAGAPGLLNLPMDRPRPVIQRYMGSHYLRPLAQELVEDMRQVGKLEQATLFMSLMAAFDILLARCSGQEDLVVGTPVANRTLEELTPLIGLFVNTLALRVQVRAGDSYLDVLRQVREQTLEGYQHQELPFERLVDVLRPERSLSHSPLFQVMFGLQESMEREIALPGVVMSFQEMDLDVAKFDLTLMVLERGGEHICVWEYNTDLFEEASIARLAEQFEVLLTGIVANLQQPIWHLPLLSREEQAHIIKDWNANQQPYPSKCLSEIFEAQAEAIPDAVALVDEDGQISYGELNRRANQLAHYLQRIGVRPEELVGICMDRSCAIIIALLGVFKAGAATVMLLPSYPQQRLTFMMGDAQVSNVLTRRQFLEKLPAEHEARIICLDVDQSAWATEPSTNTEHTVGPDGLACAIYTSGSTGQPKGVMLSHRGIANFIEEVTQRCQMQQTDRVTQYAELSFDASLGEIFTAFRAGATLLIIPQDVRLSGTDLYHYLRIQAATTTALSPSVAGLLPERDLVDLRTMISAGEACPIELVQKWATPLGDDEVRERAFFNSYGPAEATISITLELCRSSDRRVSLGRPIANVQAYILDMYMQPVPVGVLGELYIGGVSLARGYLGHAEQTAERFVPNPYGDEPGARLYRSGDLARYRPDGKMEYLGRTDSQVKLRGQRIELEEIAYYLRQNETVQDCVVVMREDRPGDKWLVSYIVAATGKAVNGSMLRAHLQACVPQYMVPSAFVVLEKLPLNANGKLDQKALPVPDLTVDEQDASVDRVPFTQIEEILCTIWERVLNIKKAHLNESFFELGGHSLLAAQLVTLVNKAFKIGLSVRVIFEAPTLVLLGKRVEKALKSEAQTDLLPMPVVARDANLPLSFAQQRLWFLDQLEPGNPVYNIPLVLRIEGSLDLAVLARTLNEIVRRHESLRTSFIEVEKQPVQQIAATLNIELPLIDLTVLADETLRGRRAQLWMQREVARGFVLSQAPLLRCHLLHLDEQVYQLVLVIHHSIFDGWSAQVFLRELHQIYAAFAQGLVNPLSPLPIQYADYASWQRNWLLETGLEQEQLAYWKQQLAGAPALLELPTDHPRPLVHSHRGAHYTYRLPSFLLHHLRTTSQEQQATLFMILLAALSVLLSRYSGQEDLVVGTPMANRSREEVANLIGFFANTLTLRVDLAEHPSFQQMVQQVKERVLQAYGHQDLPFERLVEELQPQRNLGYTPLFQIMFTMHEFQAEKTPAAPGSLLMQPVYVDTPVAKFDLMLEMYEQSDELVCVWEYAIDLFEETTIARMAQHFQILLEGLLTYSERDVMQIPLLGEAEWQQTVRQEHAGGEIYATEYCLHQMFELQVQLRPDAIAVSYEQEQLSYEELNVRANRLSHTLRQLGVGPEVPVGIYIERSIEMVIGLLAILKAGGGYVPLDPASPAERLSYMIKDARIEVLLTQQILAGNVEEPPKHVLCLDRDWVEIGQQPSTAPSCQVTSDNMAYIIYTSGSTGQPKGVIVSHGNVMRLFAATQPWYHSTSEDVWTLFHSIAFDFSVWELWGALLYGGRLLVVPYLLSRSPEAFYDLLSSQQVTVLNQTPSAFHQLMLAEEMRLAPHPLQLRLVIFGGEALDVAELRPWFRRHGDQLPRLVNMYGITETTVHVTYHPLKAADCEAGVGSVIGVSIPDLHVYVLDRNRQPVPIGVPGELYIGGPGVARGYLNRAELTSERFIADPFSSEQGGRLYKSGDLARCQPDGTLEYLGRIDQQVKIRGFRIELGEIETLLVQHPQVKKCLVMAREDLPGEKRLVAYISARQDADLTQSELRGFLQRNLPEYMIPAAFVFLEELPLTANGKIDRRALPAPDHARPDLEESFVLPRTPIEQIIADVWSEVLRLDRVGIYDNFFVLGGDSIKSVRILASMKERGLQYTLQQLFLHQTIAELASVLPASQEQRQLELPTGAFCLSAVEDRAKLPPGIEDAYPLTAMQMGMFYHLLMTPDHPLYHNVCSFYLRGTFDEQALRQALRLLVARHAILRTSFDLNSYSEPLQLVHTEAEMSLVVGDLRGITADEQERIVDIFVQEEKKRPFDLAHPPLLRFHIFRRTEETFQLTVTEFHPILDGWSYHRNLVEIFENHDLLCKQEIPDQRVLWTTFRDYVALEQQVLQSEEHRQFWMNKLQGFIFLQIPRLQPKSATPDMQSHVVPISSTLAKQLKHLAQANSLPLKSVLLAAHIKLLSLLGGTTDVLTNLVSNGRLEVVDGEEVRGLFLLAVPFRCNLAPGTWLELIRTAFAAERETQPYRHYPLPAIQEDMGGQHLFETAFNYMHFHSAADLFSQRLEIIGPVKALEETNYTLQSDFMLSYASAQLLLRLDFDASLISETQIEAISHYYQRILQTMADRPQSQHQRVCVISELEAQQQLYDWNTTSTLYPIDQGIHELFEAQVYRTPDAIALVFKDEQLTYQELNQRANQVAHALRREGIRPETLVGISMNRSPLMLVGLLGILKAGGAYLPLEPAHPAARLATIIADAGASLILTQQEVVEQLPQVGQRNICLDSAWHLFAREPQSNPTKVVAGETAIYTMYTSGSTGIPKGVILTHRNVANFFAGMDQCLGDLQQVGTWLAVTSISFDISVLELFWTLCRGFRVVIQPGLAETTFQHHQGEAALQEQNISVPAQLLRQQVTHLQCTPSFMKMLFMMPESSVTFKKLEVILLGGEALPVALAAQLRSLTPARLLNMYGPTETTVWSTSSNVEKPELGISLGQPMANTQIYVLDRYLEPVPPGVPGELCIAGDGLARGYLNHPEATAEQFIPNPWSNESGKRLYRTGDLVRYLPNRHLEYLGRLDHQVKVNGHRVELGEIESALHLCADVQECVVLAVDMAADEKRLVAYVVLTHASSLTSADLRQMLQAKLPHAMIPSAFVYLDRLPLTVNGKLDRRALPAPAWEGENELSSYAPPRTALEEQLAKIWSQVLGKVRIGIHDNFFVLGGDSILLVQIVARATQAGIPLEIRHILNYQTIAEVSALIVELYDL